MVVFLSDIRQGKVGSLVHGAFRAGGISSEIRAAIVRQRQGAGISFFGLLPLLGQGRFAAGYCAV